MGREADDLAFVTAGYEAESRGEAAVEQAEAVPLPAREQSFVAAEQQFDAAAAPDPGAVGDAVAVPVRRMNERLVETAVEKGGQAVGEVMVVEMQARAAETFASEKAFGSEDCRCVRVAPPCASSVRPFEASACPATDTKPD